MYKQNKQNNDSLYIHVSFQPILYSLLNPFVSIKKQFKHELKQLHHNRRVFPVEAPPTRIKAFD